MTSGFAISCSTLIFSPLCTGSGRPKSMDIMVKINCAKLRGDGCSKNDLIFFCRSFPFCCHFFYQISDGGRIYARMMDEVSLLGFLGTTKQTSSTGSDQPGFLTRNGSAGHGRYFAYVDGHHHREATMKIGTGAFIQHTTREDYCGKDMHDRRG